MRFDFVAKHRVVWPVGLICEALGVSRSGFYAWLSRPRSQRSQTDEVLGTLVRQSFIGSDRTYGARRVWHDVLALGQPCGLHRVERLMRLQALRARPRRRGLLKEQGITCSMSRAGEVWDNSAMESFFSSLKTERTAKKVYRSREQARADVFDYIERFYNPKRRHSTLGYVSPIDFEKASEA